MLYNIQFDIKRSSGDGFIFCWRMGSRVMAEKQLGEFDSSINQTSQKDKNDCVLYN